MTAIAVSVNGERVSAPQDCRLEKLLEQLSLAGKKIAVELNREIVPRSDYGSRVLQDGDHLEIVQAIGGG